MNFFRFILVQSLYYKNIYSYIESIWIFLFCNIAETYNKFPRRKYFLFSYFLFCNNACMWIFLLYYQRSVEFFIMPVIYCLAIEELKHDRKILYQRQHIELKSSIQVIVSDRSFAIIIIMALQCIHILSIYVFKHLYQTYILRMFCS